MYTNKREKETWILDNAWSGSGCFNYLWTKSNLLIGTNNMCKMSKNQTSKKTVGNLSLYSPCFFIVSYKIVSPNSVPSGLSGFCSKLPKLPYLKTPLHLPTSLVGHITLYISSITPTLKSVIVLFVYFFVFCLLTPIHELHVEAMYCVSLF